MAIVHLFLGFVSFVFTSVFWYIGEEWEFMAFLCMVSMMSSIYNKDN